MKRIFPIIVFILILLVGGLYLFRNVTVNDTIVAVPSPLPSPTKTACTALTLNSPQANQKISSPLRVTVTVDNRNKDCRWTVFEAQAGTLQLLDEDKTVIGKGVLTTSEDWMTNEPVTYNGEITFDKAPTGKKLELHVIEENPSGKPDSQILTFPLTY